MKRKILPIALFGGALLSQPCLALQTFKMVDQQKTTAILSKEHYTRISVEEDRIQQIFGAEGIFDIQSDDEQGQIFLKPVHPSLSKPVSVTIVTEGGITQDLRLMPRPVEAQSILFKPEALAVTEAPKVKSYRGELVELMQGMVYENFLEDYDKMPLKTVERPAKEGLEIEPVSFYLGDRYVGRFYTLKNVGDSPLSLSEQDLSKGGDVAVLLVSKTLLPKQTTRLYVITKGERL
ncbi:MAG: type-F conjugative transfer system secretin TraK [Alphaproteobacteria bacterium]|nr:type-F conjugative transfer system secretin TraK [Alphaproteobacteria bacterium]